MINSMFGNYFPVSQLMEQLFQLVFVQIELEFNNRKKNIVFLKLSTSFECRNWSN